MHTHDPETFGAQLDPCRHVLDAACWWYAELPCASGPGRASRIDGQDERIRAFVEVPGRWPRRRGHQDGPMSGVRVAVKDVYRVDGISARAQRCRRRDSPYKQVAAQTLEIGLTSINFNDSRWPPAGERSQVLGCLLPCRYPSWAEVGSSAVPG